jgi:hypothetical protein
MIKLRTLLLVGLAAQISAFAVDPTLLRLVMPDAKVVAGLQVEHAKNSLFGQFVLSHMQLDDSGFKKFVTDTGFDPRRDVTEIVIASNWDQAAPESRWLVMARGVFDTAKIARVASGNGSQTANFQGVDVFTYITESKPPSTNAIAFFDSSSAVMGDLSSVKAAIARKQTGAQASGKLASKVREVSGKNDFWFVTLVPVSEFAGAMPDPTISSALEGDLLQAVSEASGGIRFGDNVTISGQAVTRSDKDAAALVDVFRFVANLLQMNREKDATVNQLAGTLGGLDLKTAGNVMTMSLAIPEKQLEQLFKSFRQGKKTPQAN